MALIRIDLNNPQFQQSLFSLQTNEALAVLRTLSRLSKLTWESLHVDRGLRWEAIHSRESASGHKVYSLRATRAMRILAYREGDWLRLLSIHPDHDSAYQ
jgi:hypothetical protein